MMQLKLLEAKKLSSATSKRVKETFSNNQITYAK